MPPCQQVPWGGEIEGDHRWDAKGCRGHEVGAEPHDEGLEGTPQAPKCAGHRKVCHGVVPRPSLISALAGHPTWSGPVPVPVPFPATRMVAGEPMGRAPHIRGRGQRYGGYSTGENFMGPGGGDLATLWKSQSSQTLTRKPVRPSEAERFANRMATESSPTSQRPKESAVPSTRPRAMAPRNAAPVASSLPCQRPSTSPPSLKATLSHETIPTRHCPPPPPVTFRTEATRPLFGAKIFHCTGHCAGRTFFGKNPQQGTAW